MSIFDFHRRVVSGNPPTKHLSRVRVFGVALRREGLDLLQGRLSLHCFIDSFDLLSSIILNSTVDT